jgi:hypothetical protein
MRPADWTVVGGKLPAPLTPADPLCFKWRRRRPEHRISDERADFGRQRVWNRRPIVNPSAQKTGKIGRRTDRRRSHNPAEFRPALARGPDQTVEVSANQLAISLQEASS